MPTPTTPAEVTQKQENELMALVRRAEAGDDTALPAVRLMLRRPGAADILGGDLARQAQRTLINQFSGKNLMLREALIHKLDQLYAELAGPNPTPLERLLVQRVVTCWLQLHHLEHLYGQKESMALQLGVYFQRCISAAQKRYLGAIKTLALVRKLAVPVLQVNIAKKQVNVAGACAAPADQMPS